MLNGGEMPIIKLGSKPPVSFAGDFNNPERVTISSFNGRRISIAGKPQSASFLSPGNTRQSSHIFTSTPQPVAARNITDPAAQSNQTEFNEYEEMRQKGSIVCRE